MGEVHVIEALRTPFGAFRRKLAVLEALQLAATVIKLFRPGIGKAVAMVFEGI